MIKTKVTKAVDCYRHVTFVLPFFLMKNKTVTEVTKNSQISHIHAREEKRLDKENLSSKGLDYSCYLVTSISKNMFL